jgi:hypothetical protein
VQISQEEIANVLAKEASSQNDRRFQLVWLGPKCAERRGSALLRLRLHAFRRQSFPMRPSFLERKSGYESLGLPATLPEQWRTGANTQAASRIAGVRFPRAGMSMRRFSLLCKGKIGMKVV